MSKTKKDKAEKVEKPKSTKAPKRAPKTKTKQDALPFGKLSGTVLDHPDLAAK